MDDRRRDGGTNSTLRIKEQGKHLTLNEHDDDDDDDDEYSLRKQQVCCEKVTHSLCKIQIILVFNTTAHTLMTTFRIVKTLLHIYNCTKTDRLNLDRKSECQNYVCDISK